MFFSMSKKRIIYRLTYPINYHTKVMRNKEKALHVTIKITTFAETLVSTQQD